MYTHKTSEEKLKLFGNSNFMFYSNFFPYTSSRSKNVRKGSVFGSPNAFAQKAS